jgi:hypothetical protein
MNFKKSPIIFFNASSFNCVLYYKIKFYFTKLASNSILKFKKWVNGEILDGIDVLHEFEKLHDFFLFLSWYFF